MPSGPELYRGQDWTPLIWTKAVKPKQASFQGNKKLRELDENPEVFHHTPVTHNFKQALQQARMAKKLSQADLAKALNVTPRVIQDYESGACVPSGPFIARLNAALGVVLPRLSKS